MLRDAVRRRPAAAADDDWEAAPEDPARHGPALASAFPRVRLESVVVQAPCPIAQAYGAESGPRVRRWN